MNTELETLWGDIASAIRYHDKTEASITPSTYPERIRGLEILSEIGTYPIYVTAPVGSTITATSVGGGVVLRAS